MVFCTVIGDGLLKLGIFYQKPWSLSVKTTARGVLITSVKRSPRFLSHKAPLTHAHPTPSSPRCIMPRGFLVKRYSKTSPPSSLPPASITPSSLSPSRTRRYSDEDRSDTSSDHELLPDTSEVLRKVFCGRPPPLCPDKTLPEADSPSPTFELGQVRILYYKSFNSVLEF